MTYTLTTNHAASRYNQPVLVYADGSAYGAADPPGIIGDLFGRSAAQIVNEEMESWCGRVAIAIGFGPWQGAAAKFAPPHDPDLVDKFCRMGGLDTRWGDFSRSLSGGTARA